MRDFHRSFFIVDALICMVAIVGSRLAERTLVIGPRSVRDRTARRTLIVGAGRTGRSLMRELRETAGERVVGFVDDNPRLRRRRVHGIKVVGTTHELPAILERTQPDIVLVTIPDAPREVLDAVVARAPSRRHLPLRAARDRSRPARRVRRRVRMTTRDDGLVEQSRLTPAPAAARRPPARRVPARLRSRSPSSSSTRSRRGRARRRGSSPTSSSGRRSPARSPTPATPRAAASRSTSSRSTRT